MYKAILVALIVFVLSQCSYGGETWKLIGNPWTEFDPDWSPDGNTIVYCDKRNGSSDIYLIPVEGGASTPVVLDTSDNREPAWSPDGKKIAYRSNRTGNWDIFIVEISTGISRQLTYHPDDDSWPDWSPDGSEIVFSSLRDGDRDLYIIPAEGGTTRKIAELPTWDEYPCWSTNGQTILFAALFSCDIYKVNVDGTGYGPVVDNPGRDCEPFWSPDMTAVVYIGEGDGPSEQERELYCQPYPNGEKIRLTNDSNANGWPCYSPNGRYLAYGKHTDNWEIWIYDLQGIVNIERTSLGKIKAIFR